MDKTLLHLGCGCRRAKGFINIDIQKYNSVDIVADITKDLPYDKDSIDLIYNSAVLEHLSRSTWKNVLKYWYDLLKPGGCLQLSTIDFDSICKRYMKGKDIDEIVGLLLGGSKDWTDRHGVMFDYPYLMRGLKEVGFERISLCDWRNFEPYKLDKDFDDFSRAYIPHMDFEKGQLMVLNVQCFKKDNE